MNYDRHTTVYAARKMADHIADHIVSVCGDIKFVIVHVILFCVWIATHGFGLDRWPYGMLTLLVSLEAIFLTSFVLIAQKRQDEIARKRDNLEASEVAADYQMIQEQADMMRELYVLIYEVHANQHFLLEKLSEIEKEEKDG